MPSVVLMANEGGGTLCEEDINVKQYDGGGVTRILDVGGNGNIVACGGNVETIDKIVEEGVFRNDVITSNEGGEVSCEFNRRGFCKVHKIKGEKKTQKRKAWRKKKYGYGYVTVSEVTYSCKMSMKPIDSEIGTDRTEPILSPVLANKQGDTSNYSNHIDSEVSDWTTEGAVDQLNSKGSKD